MYQTYTFDDNLLPGTQYCYNISAFDAAQNESPKSAQACATTLSFRDLLISRIYDSCDGDGCDAFDVSNNGNQDATNVTIYALNGYMGTPTSCQAFFNVTVPGSAFVSLDTFIDVLGGFYDYYIIIDPTNTIPESNKANNTACSGLFCTNPPVWPADFVSCTPYIP
jgi:hypothetical protein